MDASGVGLIEPNHVHTYRPLLSYVGGGQASMGDAERTQRSVIPRGCTWQRDSAPMFLAARVPEPHPAGTGLTQRRARASAADRTARVRRATSGLSSFQHCQ
ncbi:hypothetical protein NIIDNTM18_04000 [Mycolicibacterium litorale]|uniref:Uncharacterized protein n=1 Tax=Mycolicibacterium litorale TaxID=758802 RepID=A0A6S6NZ73_9MYCO|nr:hypothetical protein NIIDNTM18_04000 [Mycolicibacterium litorale]